MSSSATMITASMTSSSWMHIPKYSDFSLYNIPFGISSFAEHESPLASTSTSPPTPGNPKNKIINSRPRCCTLVGDTVIDLSILAEAGLFDDIPKFDSPQYTFSQSTLNHFMRHPKQVWTDVRHRIQSLLSDPKSNGGSNPDAHSDSSPTLTAPDARLRQNKPLQKAAFHHISNTIMHLPATIHDYTDFYSSKDHATNVGTMFRDPKNALNPNWMHLPVGYHGRASTVFVSGTDVVRPCGQKQKHPTDPTQGSIYGPSQLLDFELEVAFFVGGEPNQHGRRISTTADASERIFGFVLMNDWSARDIQKWEYVPLGPFNSKNFATTISPWIVTSMALEECGCACKPLATSQNDPVPLTYLQDPEYEERGGYDVRLEVGIQGKNMTLPATVSRSNLRNLYWNARQQLVHHSVTGCIMNPGDLLGSGTISGPDLTSLGCMLELNWKGTRDVKLGEGGEVRKFLNDGDVVIMKGYCVVRGDKTSNGHGHGTEAEVRVGFGSCTGKVLPAAVDSNPSQSYSAESTASMEIERYLGFKLYGHWRSSSSWRVRIALAAKSIPVVHQSVDILQGESKKNAFASSVNGMKQVPVLECVDGVTGKCIRVTQSFAIVQFLEEAFPSRGFSILPVDVLDRARVRELSEIVNSGIQPLQNLSTMDMIDELSQPSSDENIEHGKAFGKASIEEGLRVIETLVKQYRSERGVNAAGPFATGGFAPTLADACIVPQMYNARRFGVDLHSTCPSLLEIEKVCLDHPWFQTTHPDAMRDS